LYKAAFDRLPDPEDLNYWLGRWEEETLSLSDIADGLYNAVEFSDTYGNLSNTDYITQLYANVLDRHPMRLVRPTRVMYWAQGTHVHLC